MSQLTKKEIEIIDVIKKNPYLEQEEIAYLLGISRSAVAGHLARLIKKGILQRGYILNESIKGIAVVGGANIDVKGMAATPFRKGSSNPGKVFKTAGGVARNIAENLGRLKMPVSLFSVVGHDEEGEWLIEVTRNAGVNTQHVERIIGERTGLYLSVLDENKEQVGSISDMGIMDRFDESILNKLYPKLLNEKLVFIDTNLPQETLIQLVKWLKDKDISIVIDPVSAKKAEKLRGLLDGVELITPNKEEAEILTGITISSEEDINSVAEHFFSQGVKKVVITLGAEGVFIANLDKRAYLPSPNVEVKDTTGAGDAFMAGVIYGLVQNKDIFEACKYGHSMAAITLSKEQTVAEDLTDTLLEKSKKELFA